jgi:hypothetical protein
MTINGNDNYTRRYLVQAAKGLKVLQRFIPEIPKLDGFSGDWKEEHYWYSGEKRINQKYVLSNETAEIKLTFNPGGDGSTSFKVAGGGWRTFDRIGVSASFYWKSFDRKGAPKVDLNEVFKQQLERIAKHREYSKTAITIPQIGHTVSPDGLKRLKEEFKTKGWHSFHPSGFGTGYTVSVKKLRYGERATKELETFIGIAPLYVEKFRRGLTKGD